MVENSGRFGLTSTVLGLVALSFLVHTLAGYNYFLDAKWKTLIKFVTPVLIYVIYLNFSRVDHGGVMEIISYNFFSVSVGFLLAWSIGDILDYLPNIPADSMMGWAVSKLGEVAPICIPIFLLAGHAGESFSSWGLTGGDNYRSIVFGLAASILGLIQYVAMVGVTVSFSISQFQNWLPWMVIFAFSNSIMEELIFRGLFLRKYALILGDRAALVLVSLVFALFHVVLLPFMGASMVVVFMFFLFFQGYVWGYILQKTGSIWGSIIVHAIADILFLLATFSIGQV